MMKNHWLKKMPIAHRGLWGDGAPENSYLAFERAMEQGYPIEIDVQILADGTLVVFHDWTLDRMTQENGRLSEKKWNDVSDLCLLKTQYTIPQMKDVLKVIDGKVPLIIEMKNQDYKNSNYLEKLYNVLRNYDGEFVLSSFNPFLVNVAKDKFKGVFCGQNFLDYRHKGKIQEWFRKKAMHTVWFVSNNTPDFFVCESKLLPQKWILRIAQKRGVPLLIWGVKNREEYEEKKSYIDNYIFDKKTYE